MVVGERMTGTWPGMPMDVASQHYRSYLLRYIGWKICVRYELSIGPESGVTS